VKIGTTAAQKKLFFNLRRLRGQMKAIDGGQLTPDQVEKIATQLDVSKDEVITMDRRLAGPDSSLNAPVRGDEEGSGEWQDWLVDETPNQETRLVEGDEFDSRKVLLTTAMAELNERERDILSQRRLTEEPTTLEDLSARYGISRERVRQIEVRAFEKLQKAVRNAAAQRGMTAQTTA
jgi:RNA polymerase sigma-32 factor